MSHRHEHKKERVRAFEKVVAEYEPQLLRYAARILNRSDAAQDVVQNAFLRLFTRWKDAFIPGAQLSTWLFRVCHNCAVDHIRREQRRAELHERSSANAPAFIPPDRGRDSQISDAAVDAVRALNVLSLKERQVVILKVYEEKSYKEIGEIAGLSAGNVGYILHHALRKMAEHLKGSDSL